MFPITSLHRKTLLINKWNLQKSFQNTVVIYQLKEVLMFIRDNRGKLTTFAHGVFKCFHHMNNVLLKWLYRGSAWGI